MDLSLDGKLGKLQRNKGRLAEWSIALTWKVSEPETVPLVRIQYLPPKFQEIKMTFYVDYDDKKLAVEAVKCGFLINLNILGKSKDGEDIDECLNLTPEDAIRLANDLINSVGD